MRESFADVPQRCLQVLQGHSSVLQEENFRSDPAAILDKVGWGIAVGTSAWEKSKNQPLKQRETTFQGHRI